jgi:hypothetical protein
VPELACRGRAGRALRFRCTAMSWNPSSRSASDVPRLQIEHIDVIFCCVVREGGIQYLDSRAGQTMLAAQGLTIGLS